MIDKKRMDQMRGIPDFSFMLDECHGITKEQWDYVQSMLEKGKQTIMEDLTRLTGEVVDKINLLNRIQIDRMDQFKGILFEKKPQDLRFLIQVLDKELSKYPDYFENDTIRTENYKGFKDEAYEDGNGY